MINNYKIVEAYDFDYLDYLLTVGFTEKFPYDIPYFKINDNQKLIPHVDQTGYICTTNIEDIELDTSNPYEIIDSVVQDVIHILSMSAEEIKEELRRELSDYLSRNINVVEMPDAYKKSGVGLKEVFLYDVVFDKSKLSKLYVFEFNNFVVITNVSVPDYPLFKYSRKEHSVREIYHVPLTDIPLVNPYEIPMTSSNISRFVRDSVMLEITTLKKDKIEEYLFSYEYYDSYRYFFSRIENLPSTSGRSLVNPDSKVYPYIVNIIDKSFLRSRGGAILDDSPIMLVGVGSLGSDILIQLCKSGFTNITILDFDRFSVFNTFRHAIGFSSSFYRDENNNVKYANYRKTTLLKHHIEHSYPGVKIKEIQMRFEDAFKSHRINLKNYQYIISTTGNSTVEKMITELVYRLKINTKLIFTWLEAYGVGRHILFTDGKNKGCINCLMKSSHQIRFSDDEDHKKYEDMCTGSYTVFGSTQIAILASEVVESILSIQRNGIFYNRHIVKKGNADFYTSEGYRLTDYFNLSQKEIDKKEKDYYYEGCEICG